MAKLLAFVLFSAVMLPKTAAFSAGQPPSSPQNSNNNDPSADGGSFTLFDRFRADCPADLSCIYNFDPTHSDIENLLDNNNDDIWVAVYRSNNNNPSVFVRDNFLDAMAMATSSASSDEEQLPLLSSSNDENSMKLENNNLTREKPVAVARLRSSIDFDDTWVLDSMRCILKKENMDEACDGGSEFTEALSVAVDALLLHHLQSGTTVPFQGAIRTKSTLFSSKILEERGFEPVEELAKDMATHYSAYEPCMAKYAERSISTVSKSPGARDRALQIISLLGRLDPDAEHAASSDRSAESSGGSSDADNDGSGDDNDNDPWAAMKQFI